MEALGLNITDWTILVIVTISGIISLFRGFTKEFLSLFLWVFSFLTAISLEYLVSPFISSYIGNPEISFSNIVNFFFIKLVMNHAYPLPCNNFNICLRSNIFC